jgi:predicted enzyme related to lactoylglutathione lyase
MARLVALSIGADDPPRLARFWAEALGWERDETGAAIGLVPPDDTSFGIVFRPGPEPKVGRNRIHLDLMTTSVEDRDDLVHRLLAGGARPCDVGQTGDEGHVVLADPEGNELCVIDHENGFLAGCGRLGALSCDGSRSVGIFWSRALGRPLVWDQGEETAIRDGSGPFITWGGGPELPKVGRNRLHLDVVASDGRDRDAEVEHLVALGARRLDPDPGPAGPVVLADPDDNELCVLQPE